MRSRVRATLILTAFACSFGGCNGGDTHSDVNAPGSDKSVKTRILEAGAAALQSQPPLRAINAYLDGFHFYNGHIAGQMEAHHYCTILNEDVIQCVIYDGNVKDAKIMGVEYIISQKLFEGLPAAEKALSDLDKQLPLGVPQLMMGFTADGQIDPAMVKSRDQRLGIDSEARRKDRADIAVPTIDPGADSWQRGNSVQIADPTGSQHD
jgi:hypothetical protein